jgi:hypothetical protein
MFVGCNKDEDPEYFTVVGNVSKTTDSTIVVTDTDDRLLIDNSVSLGSALIHNGRVIIYFTILEETVPQGIDYVVEVYEVTKVLYKPVIELTEQITDSIGNDPLIIRDVWIAKNYLNLNFSYYGNNQVHLINLTRAPGTITNDTIALELRHNNNDDSPAYTVNGFVTFDIESLQLSPTEEVDSVIIRFKAKEYEGHLYDKFITYKY